MQYRLRHQVGGAALTIIVINVLVFILQLVIPDFNKLFILVPQEVWLRPWTLLTSMFMHGGFTHLLFNMYGLFIFGPLIEQKVGTRRFIFIYLASGLLAGLLSTFFYSVPLLGASGALMGILGVTVMLLPHLQVLFFFIIPMSFRTAAIIFAAVDLLGVFSQSSTIAHIAHLVGLACGIGYGYYLLHVREKYRKNLGGRKKVYTVHKNKPGATYEETIMMSQDEIDDYFRKGRL